MKFILVLAICILVANAVVVQELIYPASGDYVRLNAVNNVTWDKDHFGSYDSVSIFYNVTNPDVQEQMQNCGQGVMNFTCIPNTGFYEVDLTIPVDTLQKVADKFVEWFDFPWNINVDAVVEAMVDAIDLIPLSERNATVYMTPCNSDTVYFDTTNVYLSSARTVMIGLVGLLAIVALVL